MDASQPEKQDMTVLIQELYKGKKAKATWGRLQLGKAMVGDITYVKFEKPIRYGIERQSISEDFSLGVKGTH